MRLKKYRLILILVVLMTGLSITGWSISTQYDHIFINGELNRELDQDNQTGNAISGEFRKSSPILFLISAGLIGLLGVRRQTKKIGNRSRPDENGATKISIGRREGSRG